MNNIESIDLNLHHLKIRKDLTIISNNIPYTHIFCCVKGNNTCQKISNKEHILTNSTFRNLGLKKNDSTAKLICKTVHVSMV